MTKSRKRKGPILLLAGAIVLAIVSFFAVTTVQNALKAQGVLGETVYVVVENGDTLSDVVDTLEYHELIGMKLVVELYARTENITDFKAGIYKIDRGWNAKTILTYLTDAANTQKNDIPLTIIPGEWAKEVAETIAELTEFSVEEILALWNDDAYLAELDARYTVITPELLAIQNARVKLEGYLLPETVFINPAWDLKQITQRIIDQTEVVYTENKALFDASDLSVHEVFTLASIVQFEASKESDMKMVAQVFYNRLDKPMRLQSSVTVCYALYTYESWKDCETNSGLIHPYNTYQIDGLPPGPIDNPSATALLATLQPTPNAYYFFIADVYGDGTVYYAKTYAEHLKNVEKYLR
jgi:UPF0755 protein